MRLHEAIMSNGGEVDISDINLADMDPEDIRVSDSSPGKQLLTVTVCCFL